jgi:hypothetical protein
LSSTISGIISRLAILEIKVEISKKMYVLFHSVEHLFSRQEKWLFPTGNGPIAVPEINQ